MSEFSCLLDCFAFALDTTSGNLIHLLKHDGSEIIHPDLPEPFCRRGFDVFELMNAAITFFRPLHCTLLLREITHSNMMTVDRPKLLNLDLTSKWFVSKRPIVAMTNNHAVVCKEGQVIFDPRTKFKLSFDEVKATHQAIVVF